VVSVRRKEGYGDQIMRSGHAPGTPWYVSHSTRGRYQFNMDFRAPRGKIDLSLELLEFGWRHPGHVIVEPHIKGTVSARNKDWGWARWQDLVDRVDLPWAQFDYGRELLEDVTTIKTESFWHGVAVLGESMGLVTTDGGLHHAAGALGVKAIVIWGGYAPPIVLGYDDHINLAIDEPDCLGMKAPCEACGLAMAQISVDEVASACKIWTEGQS